MAPKCMLQILQLKVEVNNMIAKWLTYLVRKYTLTQHWRFKRITFYFMLLFNVICMPQRCYRNIRYFLGKFSMMVSFYIKKTNKMIKKITKLCPLNISGEKYDAYWCQNSNGCSSVHDKVLVLNQWFAK